MTLGRRGSALLVFAGLDIVYGVRLLTVPPDATPFYTFVHSTVPLWVPGAAWLGVAVLCVAQAWRRGDRTAFVAAITIKELWALLYIVGWLSGQVPDGWVSAATWTAFAILVGIVAGWPEPVEEEVHPWTRPSA